jgi:hypothetical protein
MNFSLFTTAALFVSVAASAATPLGPMERRSDNDPTVKSRQQILVTIKHKGPVAFKLKTASIHPKFLAHAKNNVIVKKGAH